MTIKPGDMIPALVLKRLGANGLEDVDTGTYFKGRKIIMFGTPGAFTPTCAQKHLPGYVTHADSIKAKGFDEIICLSVNDPFVMQHWGEIAKAAGRVTMLPDGNGDFTRAMDIGMDGSGAGLGFRCKRFLMVVDDGIVKDVQIEDKAGEMVITGAESCVLRLDAMPSAA